MRTHKIIFKCNSSECAKWYEEEILHADFCDLTHWYCGLDNTGDDTPELCIIYRGIIHPEIITVEVDAKVFSSKTIEENVEILREQYKPRKLVNQNFEILDVQFEELSSYTQLKELTKHSECIENTAHEENNLLNSV